MNNIPNISAQPTSIESINLVSMLKTSLVLPDILSKISTPFPNISHARIFYYNLKTYARKFWLFLAFLSLFFQNIRLFAPFCKVN